MTQNNTGVVFIGLLTMVFFIFFVSTAFVEEKVKKNTKPKNNVSTTEKSSASLPAMKVGKDADGSVRPPTRAEENKLNAELKKTLDKYQKHSPKQNPDGSLSLVVAPHHMNVTVAHIGPDGKVHLNCSDESGHIKTNVQTKEELPEE